MRFADSDYGSDDPGNSDISDDVHYEASLLNRSSDYTRPRPRKHHCVLVCESSLFHSLQSWASSASFRLASSRRKLELTPEYCISNSQFNVKVFQIHSGPRRPRVSRGRKSDASS